MGMRVPVLDLSAPAFVDDLCEVIHEVGTCYLVGHQVPQARIDTVFEMAHAFFALPEVERLAVDKVHSPRFRGYTPVGREVTSGHWDWREVFDVARERPEQPVTEADPPWRRLIGPNQWPAALPELRAVVTGWLAEVDRLGGLVLRALARGLGQPEDRFDPWFGEQAHVRVKLVHYLGRPHPGHEQGVGVHKDRGFMGFVLQDEVGGLQISDGAGGWLEVPPRPGALVLNFGEMSEVATGGYVRATPHRVVAPRAGQERFSVIGFYNPRLEARLAPVALPSELAGKARGISDDPHNPYFAQFGENELKGWFRGHPHVARLHYPQALLPGGEAQR
ncbi:isopenicillin N synthase family dioxygenase [Streptomyces sp. NPDC060028]|uniref:isopenicillin N synthase family dioxygenase n=1 Tax=Streptomyces sp. NPDC060028 TaxID=3347041 RepID=UPI0036BFAE85